MITTEEIAIRVFQMLSESEVASEITGVIDYERTDYTKEDVIIIPRSIIGEDSVRPGQINVNIHVPDLKGTGPDGATVFRINFDRLIDLRSKVIKVLKNHYEKGAGYNWYVGLINPPMKEENHDEHFVSIALELTVREKKQTN